MGVDFHRALIALDVVGNPRVLATDSHCIAGDAAEIGTTDADELGLVSAREVGPGLWLWGGACTINHRRPADDQVEYTGTLRPVLDMTEAMELFQMRAPDLFPDDSARDSPRASRFHTHTGAAPALLAELRRLLAWLDTEVELVQGTGTGSTEGELIDEAIRVKAVIAQAEES